MLPSGPGSPRLGQHSVLLEGAHFVSQSCDKKHALDFPVKCPTYREIEAVGPLLEVQLGLQRAPTSHPLLDCGVHGCDGGLFPGS